jgi:hypothetical protein
VIVIVTRIALMVFVILMASVYWDVVIRGMELDVIRNVERIVFTATMATTAHSVYRDILVYIVLVIVMKTVITVLHIVIIVKHVNLDFMEVTASLLVLLNA